MSDQKANSTREINDKANREANSVASASSALLASRITGEVLHRAMADEGRHWDDELDNVQRQWEDRAESVQMVLITPEMNPCSQCEKPTAGIAYCEECGYDKDTYRKPDSPSADEFAVRLLAAVRRSMEGAEKPCCACDSIAGYVEVEGVRAQVRVYVTKNENDWEDDEEMGIGS